MQIVWQKDPRWSFKKIGSSNETVGQKGCVISSVSMSSSYYGCFKDPGYLAKYLKFTLTGLLIWQSIADVLCCKFLWRGYPSNFKQAEIDEALKNPNKTCLLNVQNGAHWVLGIYRVPFTTKYWVADPWTGSRKFYSGVIGYSILQRK
jgi:hypothetical protein